MEAIDLHTNIVQSTLTQFGFLHRNVQQSTVRIECMAECEVFETLLVFGEMRPPYIPVRFRVLTDCTSPRGMLVVENALKGTCKRQWTAFKTAAAAKGVSHWSRRWRSEYRFTAHTNTDGVPNVPTRQMIITAWITVWSASEHNATTTKPNASPPAIPIKISDHQSHSFSLPFL